MGADHSTGLKGAVSVAACHAERKAQQLPHLSSLILCPPTLVGHWPHEIVKFVGSEQVSVMQAGTLPSSPATGYSAAAKE